MRAAIASTLIVVALSLAAAGPTSAQKKGSTGGTPGRSVEGTVSSVTSSAITITVDGAEQTFAIDKMTRVTARGAGKSQASAKAAGKTTITDFVSMGDRVTVEYAPGGSKNTARTVTVKAKEKG